MSAYEDVFSGDLEPIDQVPALKATLPQQEAKESFPSYEPSSWEQQEDVFVGEWNPLEAPLPQIPKAKPPVGRPPEVISPYQIPERREIERMSLE
jgi:hypothetical protein